MPTAGYKLRLDSINPDVCLHLCKTYSPEAWVWSTENVGQENPHSHFYLELDKTPALRAYIRKTVGSGNTAYSLKKMDSLKPVEYLAYIIKCGEFRSHNVALEEAQAYDSSVKDKMKSDKKRMSLIDKVIQHHHWDTEPPREYHYIIGGIIQYYKDQGTLIREFQLVSLAQTLFLKFIPDYGEDLTFNIYKTCFKKA